METLYTPLDRLDAVWPAARPHIEAGLFYGLGEYEAGDIKAELDQGGMQLWCVLDDRLIAAVATQVLVYPRKRALRLVAAGGERLAEWLPLLDDALTDYARRRDCDWIETHGRPGWVRRLRGIGFEHVYTTAIREMG